MHWAGCRARSPRTHSSTLNESDALFGKWCDGEREKCFWMIAVRQTCEDSAEYPALLNSHAGAIHVNLTCAGAITIRGSRYHRLIISEFDQMSQIVREGKGRMGLAFPMEDGAFRVSRFSLQGGTAALTRMEALEAQYVRTKSRTTRDRVL